MQLKNYMVEYSCSRLCFKADLIEPLRDEEYFVVHTKHGVFKFSKLDFYKVFPNVIATKSYRVGRLYSYTTPPKRAFQFLISAKSIETVKPLIKPSSAIASETKYTTKLDFCEDLVGNAIREKIKEIGILWRNSPNNPAISRDVVDMWEKMIEEWIDDETMPLIVRKQVSRRGHSVVHKSGREIIISDNTVAIWAFANVLKGKVFSLSEIRRLLQNRELPIVFMSTKEIRENAKYAKALVKNPLSDWRLCHISPVGLNTNRAIEDLSISEIKDHFRKYISPRNMFVLPKEIGYLGEIDEFIKEQVSNG